jgi:hypothetical protein
VEACNARTQRPSQAYRLISDVFSLNPMSASKDLWAYGMETHSRCHD